MTPGCRRVRSFFSAFLASGSDDLFAAMSKENILQLLPSSYNLRSQQGLSETHGPRERALELRQREE